MSSRRVPTRRSFSDNVYESIPDEFPHSDSEAVYPRHNSDSEAIYPRFSGSSAFIKNGRVADDFDDDDDVSPSHDEFGINVYDRTKVVRTGRQRKKFAARSKGGEFREKKKKRRLYFCCISSEIDIQKLHDALVGGANPIPDHFQYHLYSDVLHLFRPKKTIEISSPIQAMESDGEGGAESDVAKESVANPILHNYSLFGGQPNVEVNDRVDFSIPKNFSHGRKLSLADPAYSHKLSSAGGQDVFVYDFGAVVFWGFSRGEEISLLKLIREHSSKGKVSPQEFPSGEDDMAYVLTEEDQAQVISIANDVVTLPGATSAKQRLSVSFAIAQSAVLSIFEARIEKKVEEYKYIPETLAEHGMVHLTERKLGQMIGEVFVIRHDVNLHTEILDTPDFFWKDGEEFEGDYKMTARYLEMQGRTEVLNKRLDMLRELLDVLQQQMENDHGVKLEWIVIWLIVVEVVLQMMAIGGPFFGLW